jgi:hypothetical protein
MLYNAVHNHSQFTRPAGVIRPLYYSLLPSPSHSVIRPLYYSLLPSSSHSCAHCVLTPFYVLALLIRLTLTLTIPQTKELGAFGNVQTVANEREVRARARVCAYVYI